MRRTSRLQVNYSLPLPGSADLAAINSDEIVDGRAAGRQSDPAPVTTDKVVDKDASTRDTGFEDAHEPVTVGTTSADVPVQGMSSKELRRESQPGRKRQGDGLQKGTDIRGSGDISKRDVEGAGGRI
ncbi:hypothetical protein BJ138DRAFT_1154155 [Hygrophoropsis aurantiaca]|uniref:Uncharacterized protein n=1 Tax=Hygrophoropsis aurantiaca TaxID=72124 RepID=A0ACB8AA11_9AGAM|nr:hypothetical protein BJ138DRAFT_1154155 [Hygrophoropsis aurantiaca]